MPAGILQNLVFLIMGQWDEWNSAYRQPPSLEVRTGMPGTQLPQCLNATVVLHTAADISRPRLAMRLVRYEACCFRRKVNFLPFLLIRSEGIEVDRRKRVGDG